MSSHSSDKFDDAEIVSRLTNPPSLIISNDYSFLIMDAPTDQNLDAYIRELQERHIRKVVRTCVPTYSCASLERRGMNVEDLSFPDGQPPSDTIINKWLRIVEGENKKEPRQAVAVHCVAGLGRSPVLVAIALIELAAMDPWDAIDLIRSKRRGAINQKQANYLARYTAKHNENCCVIL